MEAQGGCPLRFGLDRRSAVLRKSCRVSVCPRAEQVFTNQIGRIGFSLGRNEKANKKGKY
jgi:hypothetical protein